MPSELAGAAGLRGTGQRELSWRARPRRRSSAPRFTWIKITQLPASSAISRDFLEFSPFSEFSRASLLTDSNLIIPATPGHPVRKIYE